MAIPVTSDPHVPDVRAAAAAAAAADDLYTSHAPLLRHIAIRKFNVPRGDVDALVHDVFTTYFARPGAVQSPRPYLIGAICNAARHYWRDRKNEEAALGKADLLTAAPHEHPVEGLSRRLLLATTLSRIGGKCRELLRRYYLDEETTLSIAESRGTTPDYILLLLHKCRKSAREIARALIVTS